MFLLINRNIIHRGVSELRPILIMTSPQTN